MKLALATWRRCSAKCCARKSIALRLNRVLKHLTMQSTARQSTSTLLSGPASLLRGLVMTVLIGSLQAYKLVISPLLGSRCRFHPSCSSYAQQSIERFGPLRGTWLAVLRLVRCGPWHPGGLDEVPEQLSNQIQATNQCQANVSNASNRNRA